MPRTPGNIIDETGSIPIVRSSESKNPGRTDDTEGTISGPEDRGIGASEFEPIEPATERISSQRSSGSDATDEPEPRRTRTGRIDGRTRAGRGTRTADAETTEVQGNLKAGFNLTDLLVSLHMMGEKFLGIPDLSLDPDEAKQLANAIKKVNEFYPVIMEPKKMALANLGAVCAQIYGPRIVAAFNNSKNRPRPEKVTPISEAPQPQQRPAPPQSPMMTPSQVSGEIGAM